MPAPKIVATTRPMHFEALSLSLERHASDATYAAVFHALVCSCERSNLHKHRLVEQMTGAAPIVWC